MDTEKIFKRIIMITAIISLMLYNRGTVRHNRGAENVLISAVVLDHENTISEQSLIDSCKISIINRVMEMDSIEDKQHVVNKIKNIHILFNDSFNMDANGKDNLGMYFDLDSVDYIVVSNSKVYNVEECVLHELNHFVDKLLTKDSMYWSVRNNMREIIDTSLSEKQFRDRVSFLMYKTDYELLTDEELYNVEKFTNFVWENKQYYTSNAEVYVRYHSMKRKMVEFGIIKTTKEKIDFSDVSLLIVVIDEDNSNNFDEDYIPLLMFISLDKLDKNIQ